MNNNHHAASSVVIVGGGLCGLALANFLRSRDVSVTVYEQRESLGEVGAGVQVDPSTWRLLQGAGLADGLAGIAERHTRGEMRYRKDGTPLPDEEAESPALPYPCHRADLLSVLRDGIDPGLIHAGHRCIGYTRDADGATVHFANGTTAHGDVIIGADGVHSVLRGYVTTPSPPTPSGWIAYRGVVPSTRVSPWYTEGLRIWMGDNKHILIYPIRKRELLNFAGFVPGDTLPEESWSGPTRPEGLAQQFAGWAPEVCDFIAQVDFTFLSGVYDREPLEDWTDGRLILIGDAAHPFVPHYAQGVNQAIEDAAGLAQILATVLDTEKLEGALRAFATHRRSRTDRIAEESRREGARYDSVDGYQDLDRRDREMSDVARRRFERWLGGYDVERETTELLRRL